MVNPELQPEIGCTIEIDEEWVNSLQQKALNVYQNRRAGEQTIFKVPWNIRKRDPDAYVPKIISLGPYHHRERCLQAGNELKLHFLSLFLRRYSRVALQDYLKKLKTLGKKARSSYSEDIDMEGKEFVEMLLLDGCFVVEFLHQFEEGDYPHPFFKILGASNHIINDMLMLENQLPFFVLESIFDLAMATDIQQSKLKHLAFCLCKSLFPNGVRMPLEESVHLLHFLHSCIAPTQRQQQENAQSSITTPESIPCAISLAEAGVKFRGEESVNRGDCNWNLLALLAGRTGVNFSARLLEIVRIGTRLCPLRARRCSLRPLENEREVFTPCSLRPLKNERLWTRPSSSRPLENVGPIPHSARPPKNVGLTEEDKSFLDITFVNGVLSIPTLKIYDNTDLLLRNLIAFEQCFPAVGNYVAAYSEFMDFIIDTPMDVALLRQKKVIVNCLGSDEDVAVLCNNLCKGVIITAERGYLSDVVKDVTRYCSSRRHRYRQKLMHDYLNSPWAIISLVAAVLLLLLTAIQAVFSVLSYFKSGK